MRILKSPDLRSACKWAISAFCAIALVGILLSLVLLADKAYFPVIAAAITGCGTLCGVFIAYLLLKINYINLSSPFRLELYKDQCKIIIELNRKVSELHFAIDMYLMAERILAKRISSSSKDDGVQREFEKLIDSFVPVHQYLEEHELLLPEGISKLAHAIVKCATEDCDLVASKSICEQFKNACRIQIGTDLLGEDTLKLIQQQNITFLARSARKGTAE